MYALVGITVATSLVDSLNPSAIAQQILLQTQVKRRRHILFFILGIGLANTALGLGVYYGLMAHLAGLWATLSTLPLFRGAVAVAGALCAALGGYRLAGLRAAPEGAVQAPRASGLRPWSLFLLGVTFCAVELTSALPYFGFLAILSGYGLPVAGVLAFVAVYSAIYAAPLVLVYLAYNRLRATALIGRLEAAVGRISGYILPVALVLLGAILALKAAGPLS